MGDKELRAVRWVSILLPMCILAYLFSIAALGLIPGSWYFEAKIEVSDITDGEPAEPVKYTRAIHRTQRMHWNAEIQAYPAKNKQFCEGGDSDLYSVSESKVRYYSLAKFTNAEHCDLPPGRYVINVCWEFFLLIFLKPVCESSNVFTVKATNVGS